jgi:hypothetical protein
MQIREDINRQFQALRTTTLMRVLHLNQHKTEEEQMAGSQLSAAVLAKSYKEKLRLAPGCEAVSASFIDMALTFIRHDSLRPRSFAYPRLCCVVLYVGIMHLMHITKN